jgi:hypothetical protein
MYLEYPTGALSVRVDCCIAASYGMDDRVATTDVAGITDGTARVTDHQLSAARNLSESTSSIEYMFEELFTFDLDAEESALVEAISSLERLKAAAAARQARLAAALDTARRSAEAAAGDRGADAPDVDGGHDQARDGRPEPEVGDEERQDDSEAEDACARDRDGDRADAGSDERPRPG